MTTPTDDALQDYVTALEAHVAALESRVLALELAITAALAELETPVSIGGVRRVREGLERALAGEGGP